MFYVSAGPHEIEKITRLSRFAEICSQTAPYLFNILDFKRFIEPFLKLRAEQGAVLDGSFTLKIEGRGSFLLSSKDNNPEINENLSAPDLVPDSLKAARFLFNPVSKITEPKIRENAFLQSLLPLPLFFEILDGV